MKIGFLLWEAYFLDTFLIVKIMLSFHWTTFLLKVFLGFSHNSKQIASRWLDEGSKTYIHYSVADIMVNPDVPQFAM